MNKILVLNHKSNLNFKQTKEYIKQLPTNPNVQIVICPALINISSYFNTNYEIGIQNIELNYLTGETNLNQLKDSPIKYVLIGHSERKRYFNETAKEINKKIKAVLNQNLIPIICLGETKEERTTNQTKKIIENQIRDYLKDIKLTKEIIIAYEPIWSIGSNLLLKNNEIEEIISFIKNQTLNKIKVIYGGSVNQKNIKDLIKVSNIDGFLLGKSSLDISELTEIVKTF